MPVYFIQSGDSGPIKIGVAVNPEGRRANLQIGSAETLFIRRVIDGDARVERYLHEKFTHLRLSGEWFTPASDLLDLIANPTQAAAFCADAVLEDLSSPARLIVDKFGGTRKMAEHTGLPPSTIQSWKSSGLIPAHKQSEVLRLALKLGIDLSPADFFDLPDGYRSAGLSSEADPEGRCGQSNEATEAA